MLEKPKGKPIDRENYLSIAVAGLVIGLMSVGQLYLISWCYAQATIEPNIADAYMGMGHINALLLAMFWAGVVKVTAGHWLNHR